MRTLRSGCAAALLTALIAAPARAAEQPESLPAARPQTPVFAPTSLERFVRGAVPRATGQTDGAAARQPKRDSILNGVLIGRGDRRRRRVGADRGVEWRFRRHRTRHVERVAAADAGWRRSGRRD